MFPLDTPLSLLAAEGRNEDASVSSSNQKPVSNVTGSYEAGDTSPFWSATKILMWWAVLVQAERSCVVHEVIAPNLHISTSKLGDTDLEGFSHLLPQLTCSVIDIADKK